MMVVMASVNLRRRALTLLTRLVAMVVAAAISVLVDANAASMGGGGIEADNAALRTRARL